MQEVHSQNQLSNLIERFHEKPFWINTNHDYRRVIQDDKCCFNDIIGRPLKDGIEKPMFDYETEVIWPKLWEYKDIWIKKATGLGITEFFLRFMVWLACYDRTYAGTKFAMVVGPNVDLAKDLIKRIKSMFLQNHNITLPDSTDYHVTINDVEIKAYPSMNINAIRSFENVKFILVDEADFFLKKDLAEIRAAIERYRSKSDPWVVMISTPHQPGGMFDTIEHEEPSIYHKIFLDYRWGINKIYDPFTLERAKLAGTFAQEYELQYQGKIGNVFHLRDIEAAQQQYEITEYLDDLVNFPRLQGVMGLDPGWGINSTFGIVVTHFVDGVIKVVYADERSKPDHAQMIDVVWDLIQRFNVTKVLVDGSAVSFIRGLKIQWGENPNYEDLKKELDYMKVEPVSFGSGHGQEHKSMLYHAKFMLENRYIQIHPDFQKLIISLKTAVAKDGTLDKEATSYDDIFDAFRLALRPYKEGNI